MAKKNDKQNERKPGPSKKAVTKKAHKKKTSAKKADVARRGAEGPADSLEAATPTTVSEPAPAPRANKQRALKQTAAKAKPKKPAKAEASLATPTLEAPAAESESSSPAVAKKSRAQGKALKKNPDEPAEVDQAKKTTKKAAKKAASKKSAKKTASKQADPEPAEAETAPLEPSFVNSPFADNGEDFDEDEATEEPDEEEISGEETPELTASSVATRDPGEELTEEEENHRFLRGLIEALLFASDKPLTVRELARAAKLDRQRTGELVVEITRDHEKRGMNLTEIAGGYCFRTNPSYGAYVQKLLAMRPVRLSRAQLETLSIIAYRQPVTRPEVDDIRGVDTGQVIKGLLERDLVKILGKKDEPGRPMLYGTTPAFLELFSLESLKDLPSLREFTELNEESRGKFESQIGEEAPAGAALPGLGNEEDNLEDLPYQPVGVDDDRAAASLQTHALDSEADAPESERGSRPANDDDLVGDDEDDLEDDEDDQDEEDDEDDLEDDDDELADDDDDDDDDELADDDDDDLEDDDDDDLGDEDSDETADEQE